MTAAPTPKFFLHIRDRERFIEDPEGVDAPDLEAARALAVLAARELAAEGLLHGDLTDEQRFEIADEGGEIHAVLPFRDLVS